MKQLSLKAEFTPDMDPSLQDDLPPAGLDTVKKTTASLLSAEGAIPGAVAPETPPKTSDHSENEKPPALHSCSVCGKDFPYASKLQRHLRTHSGERPFPCAACEKRFPEKGLLMIDQYK